MTPPCTRAAPHYNAAWLFPCSDHDLLRRRPPERRPGFPVRLPHQRGVDQISVYRKMTVFERPGERVMVLMTAGNLAVSQAVLDGLARQQQEGGETLWNAPDMFEAARRIGNAVREVYRREADALREQGVDFNVSLIFGARSAPNAAGCSRSTPPATSSRLARNARTSRSARPSTASPSWTACCNPIRRWTRPPSAR